jgi:hypothetical protein
MPFITGEQFAYSDASEAWAMVDAARVAGFASTTVLTFHGKPCPYVVTVA